MTADFSEEVVLVTGAAGGMGRAVAGAFARAGASVVLGDVDADGGTETARLMDEADGVGVFVATDVADAAGVGALVATALDRFGALHCAVNAAAIETAALHECDDDNFDRMQAVNVRGMYLSMKHELAAMLRNAMARRGRDPQDVIDRLSLLGRFGRPEEIADAALWLCSSASSFTTGHALAVDAGYLAQ